jgi:hypothetical protein
MLSIVTSPFLQFFSDAPLWVAFVTPGAILALAVCIEVSIITMLEYKNVDDSKLTGIELALKFIVLTGFLATFIGFPGLFRAKGFTDVYPVVLSLATVATNLFVALLALVCVYKATGTEPVLGD